MNQVLIKFIKSVIRLDDCDTLDSMLEQHNTYVESKTQLEYTRDTLMMMTLNDSNREMITKRLASVNDEISNADAWIQDTVNGINAFLETVTLVQ